MFLTMAFASFAQAQTSGSITVTATTPDAFSITDEGGNIVSSTIELGTLTPSKDSALVTKTQGVRLRSNRAYKLTAQTATLTFTDSDGGKPLTLSDIGFGITAITKGGDGLNVASGHTDTVIDDYDIAKYGWPTVTNGVTPSFRRTLNDIAATAGVQVLSGTRISARGNLATDNNYMLITFGVATLPQYFTPNSSLSATITLTIAGN